MNAYLRHNIPVGVNTSLKAPLIWSAALHMAIVIVTIIGMPLMVTDPPLMVANPISIELVTIGEMTQTDRIAPPQKKQDDEMPPPPEPAKQEAKKSASVEDTPPDLTKPEPPKFEKIELQEPVEPVPPPPKKEEKPEPKKVESKPEPKKKKQPKKEATKKDIEKKPERKSFDSLLKDLAPDDNKTASADDEGALDPSAINPENGMIAPLGSTLTISQMDAIKYQISKCWYVQGGIKNAEDMSVLLRVNINRDRTVQQVQVVDRGRYNRDFAFRAAADSAQRALKNPRCSPLDLPPEKYNEWRITEINFDPRDML